MAVLAVAFLLLVSAAGSARAMPLSAPAFAQPVAPAGMIHQAQGFFERLFGPPRRFDGRRAPPPEMMQPQRERPRSRARRAAPRETRAAAEAVAKNEDAVRVLVIGDAFATGLARGLERFYAQAPHVVVIGDTNPGSGIVRDDYYDWNAQLPALLDKHEPNVVVVMLGSNDRQPMRLSSGHASVRSEAWQMAYIERVDRLLQQLAERRLPVFWVGLPIMRRQAYGEDMAYLNEVFMARTSRYGAIFVEMWDRFADEDGRYSAQGPDVIGKIRTLRSDNGINMTRTGYEKIAYFLDRELQPLLQEGASNLPDFSGAEGVPGPIAPVGPVEMEVSLTSPPVPQGESALAGGGPGARSVRDDGASAGADPAPRHRVLVLGQSLEAKPGRADDFRWPPGGDAAGRGEGDSGQATTPAPDGEGS